MPRTEFHRLTVARVDPLTDDSAAVTFDVPPGLAERFAFTPGQSLTDPPRRRAPVLFDLRGAGARRRASGCARWRAAPSPAGWCTRYGPVT